MASQMNLKFTDGTTQAVTVTLSDMVKAEDALALRGKTAETHPLQAGITGAYFACKRADNDLPAFNQWLDAIESAEPINTEEPEAPDPFQI